MQTIKGSDFPKIVIPKINEAKKSIKIVVFDWRWYPSDASNPVQLFNQSLVRAVRRGVSVSALANNDSIVATLKAVGIDAKKVFTKNLVHAKLMIIDDLCVVIGSHNYTQNAFTMNHEVSVVFDDVETAKELITFFTSLWQL
jgi:phosphatidylserine/phosphatidylglycerophosphate/cardiolipin synthase-like enzyme